MSEDDNRYNRSAKGLARSARNRATPHRKQWLAEYNAVRGYLLRRTRELEASRTETADKLAAIQKEIECLTS